MLADIVMLGADKVGSFALADVKKSLMSAALETLLDSIAEAINVQEIPRLMELNGYQDLEEYPRVLPEEVETPDLEQLSKLLSVMSTMGMDVQDPKLEEFLRRIASLPATSPEILELKEELYQEYWENGGPQVAPSEPTPPIDPNMETTPGEGKDTNIEENQVYGGE
jgi:hypothetical protein